jgi:hypothetical protein
MKQPQSLSLATQQSSLSLAAQQSSLSAPQQPSLSAPQQSSLSLAAPQPQSLSTPQPQSLSTPQPSLSAPQQPSLSAAALQPSLSLAAPQPQSLSTPQPQSLSTPQPQSLSAPQPFLSAAAPQINKLSPECLNIIEQVVLKNPNLKEPLDNFLKSGCPKEVIGFGANGVVFLTFQDQVIKICFSPYSDIYQNEDGEWKCYTLDLIISLGVTALCDYEITGGKYMGLRQYMTRQTWTLNQILTSVSTSDFIVSCMNQLLALIFNLWKNGLIHNDMKPINIMFSPKQSKKRKRPCGDDDEKKEFEIFLIDADSIVNFMMFQASNATPPYSIPTMGLLANVHYMTLVTMISCLCVRPEYTQWFHEGGLHIIPGLVTRFCEKKYSLDTIKQVIHKLLGYEQAPIVVNMLVSLIYAVALNSCEVHPQKEDYTKFITTHFPQLDRFSNCM